jgi:hypothetical protein
MTGLPPVSVTGLLYKQPVTIRIPARIIPEYIMIDGFIDRAWMASGIVLV